MQAAIALWKESADRLGSASGGEAAAQFARVLGPLTEVGKLMFESTAEVVSLPAVTSKLVALMGTLIGVALRGCAALRHELRVTRQE